MSSLCLQPLLHLLPLLLVPRPVGEDEEEDEVEALLLLLHFQPLLHLQLLLLLPEAEGEAEVARAEAEDGGDEVP